MSRSPIEEKLSEETKIPSGFISPSNILIKSILEKTALTEEKESKQEGESEELFLKVLDEGRQAPELPLLPFLDESGQLRESSLIESPKELLTAIRDEIISLLDFMTSLYFADDHASFSSLKNQQMVIENDFMLEYMIPDNPRESIKVWWELGKLIKEFIFLLFRLGKHDLKRKNVEDFINSIKEDLQIALNDSCGSKKIGAMSGMCSLVRAELNLQTQSANFRQALKDQLENSLKAVAIDIDAYFNVSHGIQAHFRDLGCWLLEDYFGLKLPSLSKNDPFCVALCTQLGGSPRLGEIPPYVARLFWTFFSLHNDFPEIVNLYLLSQKEIYNRLSCAVKTYNEVKNYPKFQEAVLSIIGAPSITFFEINEDGSFTKLISEEKFASALLQHTYSFNVSVQEKTPAERLEAVLKELVYQSSFDDIPERLKRVENQINNYPDSLAVVYQWLKKESKNLVEISEKGGVLNKEEKISKEQIDIRENLVDFFKVKIDSMSLIHYLIGLPGAEQLLYSIFKANEYYYDELIFELTTYSKITVLSNVLGSLLLQTLRKRGNSVLFDYFKYKTTFNPVAAIDTRHFLLSLSQNFPAEAGDFANCVLFSVLFVQSEEKLINLWLDLINMIRKSRVSSSDWKFHWMKEIFTSLVPASIPNRRAAIHHLFDHLSIKQLKKLFLLWSKNEDGSFLYFLCKVDRLCFSSGVLLKRFEQIIEDIQEEEDEGEELKAILFHQLHKIGDEGVPMWLWLCRDRESFAGLKSLFQSLGCSLRSLNFNIPELLGLGFSGYNKTPLFKLCDSWMGRRLLYNRHFSNGLIQFLFSPHRENLVVYLRAFDVKIGPRWFHLCSEERRSLFFLLCL
ncbi:hypothetical protein AYO29_04920 [Coxiella burnetii str. Schperling]|nr:hypothetical protein AYO29_04920 [Coxiella burnetii str. Schperling]